MENNIKTMLKNDLIKGACYNMNNKRNGLIDIWNAYMVKCATFMEYDIPFCPTTATTLPDAVITYSEAIAIYRQEIKNNNSNFFFNAFVCFYMDDVKFDGPRGIWNCPKKALTILKHFTGVITPDFSTYQDFPLPLKLYNTYRMRAFGYWLATLGIPVINNIRWGTEESFAYCFQGIPTHSIVSIGTVGGSPRKLVDRLRFERGLEELIKQLHPHTIIIYGSANYPCLKKLKDQGIHILSFPSKTAQDFARRESL